MECKVISVFINDLKPGVSPRHRELDSSHVATLAELEGRWPPILVSRDGGRVIDGHHRIAAARLIGLKTLPAIFFEGSAEEAFVEAVRRNVQHGLPLTIQERRAGARRIFELRPEWSDRRIAEVCALSPRSVARIRAESDQPNDPLGWRIGLDGRPRRARPETNRLRIVDALKANPTGSLRTIAQTVGASPETVRRVRQRLSERGELITDRASQTPPPLSNIVVLTSPAASSSPARQPSVADPGVVSTADGKEFAHWFDGTDPGPDWAARVMAVPLSRVYEVADEARQRAGAWSQFGQLVEERARSSRAM
jgi:hypothetical protein